VRGSCTNFSADADRDLEILRNELSYSEQQTIAWETSVKLRTVVVCSKCQQPIASGEGWSFVRFKIPGKEGFALGTAGKAT
jgi:hypothetical protein